MQAGLFCFFAGGSGILNSNWQWKEEATLCSICMCDFKSYLQQDCLAYCTRPVSVHLAMACVGCSFDSFSIFLLSLKNEKQSQDFFCFPVSIFQYGHTPQEQWKKKYFILVNCMGWQVWHSDNLLPKLQLIRDRDFLFVFEVSELQVKIGIASEIENSLLFYRKVLIIL